MTVIQFPGSVAPVQQTAPKRPSVNSVGVTIVMAPYVLFTKEPNFEDNKFLQQMKAARLKWERDGRPKSGDEA